VTNLTATKLVLAGITLKVIVAAVETLPGNLWKLEAKRISSVDTSHFAREVRDIWQTYLDSSAYISTEWKEHTQKQQAKHDDLLDSCTGNIPCMCWHHSHI
jgi:hypothetical protein